VKKYHKNIFFFRIKITFIHVLGFEEVKRSEDVCAILDNIEIKLPQILKMEIITEGLRCQ